MAYITGRSQYVVYDGHKSRTMNLTCGVPQGLILGPLLFIIYVNDICMVSALLFKIAYADDTCVGAQGHKFDDLINTLNSELCSLNTWLLCNKLTLNTKKTYCMVFQAICRIKTTSIDTSINSSKLKRVKCYKYFGLMVDHKLTINDYILSTKSSIFIEKNVSGIYTTLLYTHI